MTGKITTVLQKIPSQSRRLWGALLLAVLVHILLLSLFRAAPAGDALSYGELSKVNRIELDFPGNRQFARWLENHDPALMTSVDKSSGYSRILAKMHKRQVLEDLPSPLLLSAPRTPQLPEIKGCGTLQSSNLQPDETFRLTAAGSNVEAAPPVVQNRKVPAAFPEMAMRMLERAYSSIPAAGRLLPATVIAVKSPRLTDMAQRLMIVQSCGNEVLDNAALRAVTFYAGNEPESSADSEIFVNWSNINIARKDAE